MSLNLHTRNAASGDGLSSIRASCRCGRHAGFGIASMSNQLPSSLVWSAVGFPLMLITYASRNRRRLAARSATSSQSRCAVDIIAKSITAVMRAPGGKGLGSIRPSARGRYGSKRIRYLQPQLILKLRNPLRPSMGGRNGRCGNYETNQILKAGSL